MGELWHLPLLHRWFCGDSIGMISKCGINFDPVESPWPQFHNGKEPFFGLFPSCVVQTCWVHIKLIMTIENVAHNWLLCCWNLFYFCLIVTLPTYAFYCIILYSFAFCTLITVSLYYLTLGGIGGTRGGIGATAMHIVPNYK